MAEKISLSGVPETMLQTVYARAKETEQRGAICDKKAVEIVKKLDYDFLLADKDTAMSSGVIARTIVLDRRVKQYLEEHPGAVVVNIACGLDTRCYRMEGYTHWYNLDLPETMVVREELIPENGTISQIAMSAMDDWSGEIQEKEPPALVIIEGLTMYLNPMVVRNFKEKSIEGSHAKFTWGIKDGRTLEKILPDFVYVEEHSLTEGMAAFIPVYKVLDKIPFVKSISNRIVVLRKDSVE